MFNFQTSSSYNNENFIFLLPPIYKINGTSNSLKVSQIPEMLRVAVLARVLSLYFTNRNIVYTNQTMD
jgi:hypothetical protein